MALHEIDIWNRALGQLGERRIALDTAKSTSGTDVTNANPPVVTVTTHGYATGDFVLAEAMDEMTELNGRVFRATKINDNSFSLDDEDASGYMAEATGGTFRKLKTTAVRASECYDAWREVRDEVLKAGAPWKSVSRFGRAVRLGTEITDISGMTAANPIVITTTGAHGITDGRAVYLKQVQSAELNNRWFKATVLSTTTFSIPVDGTDADITVTTTPSPNSIYPTKLATLVKAGDSDHVARYPKPDGTLDGDVCMRVLGLVDGDEFDNFIMEGDDILTRNFGDTLRIRFIKREIDVTKYDVLLEVALSHRLAAEVAEKLGVGKDGRLLAEQNYERKLSMAKRIGAKEQSSSAQNPGSWLLARLGGQRPTTTRRFTG